jgi:hypothetical protein
VMDHKGRVLGRRVARVKAHAVADLQVRAARLTGDRGFAGVIVGCEPTGHRWRAVRPPRTPPGWGSCVCIR